MVREFDKVTITSEDLTALRENFMEHNTADPDRDQGTICLCERCSLYRAFLAPLMLSHLMDVAEAEMRASIDSTAEQLFSDLGINVIRIPKER
jgi:hypothetical protein